jgi:hypothetical protein
MLKTGVLIMNAAIVIKCNHVQTFKQFFTTFLSQKIVA